MTGYPPRSETERALANALLTLMLYAAEEAGVSVAEAMDAIEGYVAAKRPVPAAVASTPLFSVVRAIMRQPGGNTVIEEALAVLRWAQED